MQDAGILGDDPRLWFVDRAIRKQQGKKWKPCSPGIRRFEGLRLRAYFCPAGVLTCGYGSTGPDIKPGIRDGRKSRPKRASNRPMRLASLAPQGNYAPARWATISQRWPTSPITSGRRDSAGSTLRRKINAGDIEGAKVELRKLGQGRRPMGSSRSGAPA